MLRNAMVAHSNNLHFFLYSCSPEVRVQMSRKKRRGVSYFFMMYDDGCVWVCDTSVTVLFIPSF